MTTKIRTTAPGSNGTELPLDAIQERVLLDRYALKDSEGRPQEMTLAALWRRVARAVSKVEPSEALKEHWAERFEAVMHGFKFVPGAASSLARAAATQ